METKGSTAADRRFEEQRIRGLNQQWVEALASGDVAAVADLYEPDGMILPPNTPEMLGREAVAAAWRGMVGLPGFSLTFDSMRIEISEAGDMAHDVGRYELAFDGPQGRVQDRGKYVTMWRKREGEWKVLGDIFNSSLPVPSP